MRWVIVALVGFWVGEAKAEVWEKTPAGSCEKVIGTEKGPSAWALHRLKSQMRGQQCTLINAHEESGHVSFVCGKIAFLFAANKQSCEKAPSLEKISSAL